MIVTIHQPNFLPWLGFFDKMAQADLFIYLDTVPYTKGGFQNRVQIKGPRGAQWLTVPVRVSGKLGQPTNEVEMVAGPWQKDHLNTLKALYGKAPGFGPLMEKLERLYGEGYERLVDFTLGGLALLRDELGVKTQCRLASEMSAEGNSSDLLAVLVHEAGGREYLSGPSGRKYLEAEPFAERGLRVAYHSFSGFEYPQLHGEFVPGLSALDYLCNDPDRTRWNDWQAQRHAVTPA